ncbi:MAG: hypothetical protein N2C12_14245 [Planctomycetales bacterium]
MQRHALAILAPLFALIGSLIWFRYPDEANLSMLGASFIRVGVMLGALWLALPHLRKVTRPVWILILACGIIIALRPKMFIPAAVILAAITVLRRRQSK